MQRLTLVLAVALLLPGVATAETVTITYNIPPGGIITADDDPESITGGKFKVTLPAATENSLLAGMGILQSFSVMALGITDYGFASTAIKAKLKAPAAVLETAAGRFTGAQNLQFTGKNTVHCDAPGTLCTKYEFVKGTQTFILNFFANNHYPTSFFFFDPGAGNGNLLG